MAAVLVSLLACEVTRPAGLGKQFAARTYESAILQMPLRIKSICRLFEQASRCAALNDQRFLLACRLQP
jgi:hypothetical protein